MFFLKDCLKSLRLACRSLDGVQQSELALGASKKKPPACKAFLQHHVYGQRKVKLSFFLFLDDAMISFGSANWRFGARCVAALNSSSARLVSPPRMIMNFSLYPEEPVFRSLLSRCLRLHNSIFWHFSSLLLMLWPGRENRSHEVYSRGFRHCSRLSIQRRNILQLTFRSVVSVRSAVKINPQLMLT